MSDEQLVRMGRTDLYRRGDTEIVNGRRVAKPGAEPVTVLTTTLDGPRPCAYQFNGMVWRVNHEGWLWERGTVADNDIVAIDPAPKLVPWEFSEIPVFHWFRPKGSTIAFPCGPVDASDGRVCIGDTWPNAREMLLDYEHCPTHCGDFQPCGKVV